MVRVGNVVRRRAGLAASMAELNALVPKDKDGARRARRADAFRAIAAVLATDEDEERERDVVAAVEVKKQVDTNARAVVGLYPHDDLSRLRAALTLQRFVRGRLRRAGLARYLASVVIQRFYRRVCVRARARRSLRASAAERRHAALVLQAVWRGRVDRARIDHERIEREQWRDAVRHRQQALLASTFALWRKRTAVRRVLRARGDRLLRLWGRRSLHRHVGTKFNVVLRTREDGRDAMAGDYYRYRTASRALMLWTTVLSARRPGDDDVDEDEDE